MPLIETVALLRRRLLTIAAKLSFLAPALIRLAVGVTFIGTGWGKLSDLSKVTAFFTELHIPFPALNAAVASSTEFFGGILILVGLGARLVALPLAFTMVVAIGTAKLEEVHGIADLLALEEF